MSLCCFESQGGRLRPEFSRMVQFWLNFPEAAPQLHKDSTFSTRLKVYELFNPKLNGEEWFCALALPINPLVASIKHQYNESTKQKNINNNIGYCWWLLTTFWGVYLYKLLGFFVPTIYIFQTLIMLDRIWSFNQWILNNCCWWRLHDPSRLMSQPSVCNESRTRNVSESNRIRRRKSAINKCHTSHFDLFLFSPFPSLSLSLSRVSCLSALRVSFCQVNFPSAHYLHLYFTARFQTLRKKHHSSWFCQNVFFFSPPSNRNSHALELEIKKG